MPCLVALIALSAPRVAIALLVFFSDWLGSAYQSNLWPLLGFFVLPYTTLAYALAVHQAGGVTGGWLVLVVVAVLVDLGVLGGGGRSARTSRAGREHKR